MAIALRLITLAFGSAPEMGIEPACAALRRGVVGSAEDTVLVLGSGGVSVFALQFAGTLGAQVISTTSTAEKAERSLRWGQPRWLTTPRYRIGA